MIFWPKTFITSLTKSAIFQEATNTYDSTDHHHEKNRKERHVAYRCLTRNKQYHKRSGFLRVLPVRRSPLRSPAAAHWSAAQASSTGTGKRTWTNATGRSDQCTVVWAFPAVRDLMRGRQPGAPNPSR